MPGPNYYPNRTNLVKLDVSLVNVKKEKKKEKLNNKLTLIISLPCRI